MKNITPEMEEQLQSARSLSDHGEFGDAMAILNSLAYEYPESELVAYEQAKTVYRYIPHYEALLAANTFVRRFPESYLGPLLQAYAALGMRRGRTALHHLNVAESLGATPTELDGPRALALWLVGRFAEAKVLATSGRDLESARVKLIVDEPQDIPELERALAVLHSRGESPVEIALHRASWYATKRMWADAALSLRQISGETDSIAVQERLAGYEFLLGELDSAFRRWQGVLARAPENIRSRNGIMRVELRRKNVRAAFKQFVLACKYGLNLRKGSER